MQITAQPEWRESLDVNANNSLSRNDARNLEGSDTVLYNPGLENIDDQELADELWSILSRHELSPHLEKMETANHEKMGPRSIAKNWADRVESLRDYYRYSDHPHPGRLEVSSHGQLRKASPDAVVKRLLKSSSSGLPYMRRKGNVLNQIQSDWAEDWGRYPCILFTRTQEQGKTRNVWGYPASDTVAEQAIFIPWLGLEKRMFQRSALHGPDDVDLAITGLLSTRRAEELVVSIDFSSYDASIAPSHIRDAFTQVASTFQASDLKHIEEVYERFISIPIWTPEGEYNGLHGVPSGSSFTNSVDSLVQMRAAGQYAERCQVQGDDGIYVVASDSARSDLIARMEDFGLNVNQDKSDTFDDSEGVYLQRYYRSDYLSRTHSGRLGGVYPLFRALLRIKYLERWTDFEREGITGDDFFSLRTIMILENCKHHPAFEEFVNMMRNRDGRGLKYTSKGASAFSKMQQSRARAQLFGGSEFERGLDNFETVKLLKKS